MCLILKTIGFGVTVALAIVVFCAQDIEAQQFVPMPGMTRMPIGHSDDFSIDNYEAAMLDAGNQHALFVDDDGRDFLLWKVNDGRYVQFEDVTVEGMNQRRKGLYDPRDPLKQSHFDPLRSNLLPSQPELSRDGIGYNWDTVNTFLTNQEIVSLGIEVRYSVSERGPEYRLVKQAWRLSDLKYGREIVTSEFSLDRADYESHWNFIPDFRAQRFPFVVTRNVRSRTHSDRKEQQYLLLEPGTGKLNRVPSPPNNTEPNLEFTNPQKTVMVYQFPSGLMIYSLDEKFQAKNSEPLILKFKTYDTSFFFLNNGNWMACNIGDGNGGRSISIIDLVEHQSVQKLKFPKGIEKAPLVNAPGTHMVVFNHGTDSIEFYETSPTGFKMIESVKQVDSYELEKNPEYQLQYQFSRILDGLGPVVLSDDGKQIFGMGRTRFDDDPDVTFCVKLDLERIFKSISSSHTAAQDQPVVSQPELETPPAGLSELKADDPDKRENGPNESFAVARDKVHRATDSNLKDESSREGIANGHSQSKMHSVLSFSGEDGFQKAPSISTVTYESSVEPALMDLYSDYRLDALKPKLDHLSADQMNIEEIFLRVMCLHSDGDTAGIGQLEYRFAQDELIYGRLCRSVYLHSKGDSERAIAMAGELVDETGAALAYAIHSNLLSYESGKRGAHHLASAKAYLTAFPDDLKAHAEYGNALKNVSHEQAVEFLESAVARFPNSAVLRNYLGHSLRQLNRLNEAKAVYDEAIRTAPEYGNLYYFRGGLCWELGQIDQYEQDTLTAAELSPHRWHRLARIVVLLRRGEFDPAISEAQSLVQSDRSDGNLACLSIALAMSGQITQAKETAAEIGEIATLEKLNNLLNGLELLSRGELEKGADKICLAWNSNALPALCQKILQTRAAGVELGYLTADSPVRSGRNTAGTASRGAVFRIRKRQANWVEGQFLMNSKPVRGWVDQSIVGRPSF